jgi:hypothetical protein
VNDGRRKICDRMVIPGNKHMALAKVWVLIVPSDCYVEQFLQC